MRILMLSRLALGTALALGLFAAPTGAATVSRLTPPSELFASGTSDPVISRFLPGQRFDLQATVQPDAGETIESFRFLVDGKVVMRAHLAEPLPGTLLIMARSDAEALGPVRSELE